ncbi:MAG: ParB/RepB/Spo0J family partition protein [Eubacteriaceae bacterium]|nr:ParB/RepB/Spo0J family partition protein [Eubacteriaceae bacterium]
MKSKKGLGKGLQALIPESDTTQNDNRYIIELDIDLVFPNKNQPRHKFDVEKLKELASSIAEHGIIQPILVTGAGDGYKIVAGERRWRAAKMAGIKKVPVIVKEITEKEVMEFALIENLQREDLNEIEEAIAYRELMNQFSLTQQDISERIGKSRAAIANTLRLLNLPENIQELISEEIITPGHGRAILSVEPDLRVKFCEKIVKEKLSVRSAEKIAVGYKKPQEKEEALNPVKRLNDEMLKDVEERLQKSLGTKVRISDKLNKGKIEIDYYSNDDLDRLLDLLCN